MDASEYLAFVPLLFYGIALADLLGQLNASLLISTYQAGKVAVLGSDQGQLSLTFHNFDRPMGVALNGRGSTLAGNVAPGLSEIGAFLPYSPLHQLLLEDFGGPLVATSGNISGEPVLTDNEDAARRLDAVADAFLHHDRPIVRPADDPVIRPMAGAARLIRPGRGVAPIERELSEKLPRPILATGGHMKNTVALAWDNRVVVSPHVGELDTPKSNDVFIQIINDI